MGFDTARPGSDLVVSLPVTDARTAPRWPFCSDRCGVPAIPCPCFGSGVRRSGTEQRARAGCAGDYQPCFTRVSDALRIRERKGSGAWSETGSRNKTVCAGGRLKVDHAQPGFPTPRASSCKDAENYSMRRGTHLQPEKENRWAVGKPRSMRNGAQVLTRRSYRCAGPPGEEAYLIASGIGRWGGMGDLWTRISGLGHRRV